MAQSSPRTERLLNAVAHAAQEAVAAGAKVSDETLLHAARATAVRVVSTQVWDGEAEEVLRQVRERMDHRPPNAPPDGGLIEDILFPCAHLLIVFSRDIRHHLDPLVPRPSSTEPTSTALAQAQTLLDRLGTHPERSHPTATALAALLHGMVGTALLLRVAALEDTDDREDRTRQAIVEQALSHLAHAPAEARQEAERALAGLGLLQENAQEPNEDAPRKRSGKNSGGNPEPGRPPGTGTRTGADPLDEIRRTRPQVYEAFGAGFARAVRLSEQAQRTRVPADIDTALSAVRDVRAGLDPGHELHHPTLSMTAHLRALRAMVTLSPQDIVAAVEAGVHALESATEPTIAGVGPLTEALVFSLVTDARGGARPEAESALRSFLAREDLDPATRLAASIGLGATLALAWAGGPDTAAQDQTRRALETAQDLLHAAPVSQHTVQFGMGLLQVNLALAALWNDPTAPGRATSLAQHLETVLRADPALTRQLDELQHLGGSPGAMMPAGPALPGLPGLAAGGTGEGGVLGMLATVQQFMPLLATLQSVTSSPALQGLLGGRLPAAETAGPLLEATLRRSRQQGGPVDLRAMFAAAAAEMASDSTGYREQVARAYDVPVSAPAPAPRDTDARLESALEEVADLLGPGRRPLSRLGRPGRTELEHAAAELRAALADVTHPGLRARADDQLALCLAELYWAGAAGPDTLAEAVGLLERARDIEAHQRPTPERADLLEVQACCYAELGRCGRLADATDAALSRTRAALRELGRCVLLEPDARTALPLAARADRMVVRAVDWCLAEERHRDAVLVVEAGRGLVLGAATLSGRVAGLLSALGRTDLADAWRRGASRNGIASPELEQVFDTLSTTPEGVSLLQTPTAENVTLALHAGNLDVAVYLVPPTRTDPEPPGIPRRPPGVGHAFLVSQGFTVEVVPLPGVTSARPGPVTTYLENYAEALAALGDPAVPQPFGFRSTPAGRAWAAALDALGSWAYGAVMQPVFRRCGVRPSPAATAVPLRMVLIPVGDLGTIPFTAAWTADPTLPGGRRYALHDAVLSQAASARLLAEATRRRRTPVQHRPVFLMDPTGEMVYGQLACDAVASQFYPDARLHGLIARDGPADPHLVLDALNTPPDGRDGMGAQEPASMLHLVTHARLPSDDRDPDPVSGTELLVGPEDPASYGPTPSGGASGDSEPARSSRTGAGWLSLGEILDHARARPEEGGNGLVICDACTTDLTLRDRDESLTLATAFLAAGASGVIGTRWPVDDDASALLTYALHHHLAGGADPADALRAAQLWMIDPDRPELPGLPWQLLDESYPGRAAEPASWAAYTHHGS
jgi:hypothetical protein